MKWVFWGATGLIAYTYVGYTGWLWVRSRLRPRPVRKGRFQPLVSIVMVVRNEEQVLDRKLENLLSLDYPAGLTQVVVVSDGSTDRTEAILREHGRSPRVRVILNQLARGKASGLNDGIELAQGEIVIFTDARQEIEPKAVRILLENFADPFVGCVSGELMLGDPEADGAGKGLGLYWRFEKGIRELESSSGSVIGATGALYAVRRDLLVPVPRETILDDVYLPMQVARNGFRVVFEPRARARDSANLGASREFARKVRTLSGNYQLLQLAPWLLTRANPLRFEFISHKLLRLAVPFALVAALVAAMFLRQPIYRIALVMQLAFYALSLLAMMRLRRGLVAGAADAAFTFVMLNTAALVAFVNFVTGHRPIWSR